ncbi:hypothetical protein PG993_012258 [Apiospora rasikravindrae]|uniref:Uncharacterized protein n=1 Tax=Apiospora rasikravindrae TaxID=990691 RepID=A0ABR1S1W1_9PEZI
MSAQGSGDNGGPGTNAWLIENMVDSDEQTTLHATFACGHRLPIFQVAVNRDESGYPDMEQVVTERLRRNNILCHTCQYFNVVREVAEDHYVEVLRRMGRDDTAAPSNIDLLTMYYDMAQTFGQRANLGQPTDVMGQCINEFCRIIIARLSPQQRRAGLENLMDLQVAHGDAQQPGGHVEIVRRLTEAITNADTLALEQSTADTTMEDPNTTSSPPRRETSPVDEDESMRDPASEPLVPTETPAKEQETSSELSESAKEDLKRRPSFFGTGATESTSTAETNSPTVETETPAQEKETDQDGELSESAKKDLESRPTFFGTGAPGSSPSTETETPAPQEQGQEPPSSDPPTEPPSSPSAQAAERRRARAENGDNIS